MLTLATLVVGALVLCVMLTLATLVVGALVLCGDADSCYSSSWCTSLVW